MIIVGISLGRTCLPATWGTHNNIRKRKEQGYNTCPFDLMGSHYIGIVKCIKEDFMNFTNPEYLTYNGHRILNTYYNFSFNHETPGHADLYVTEKWSEGTNHFINNNFANLIKRYDERIKNFRNYLSNRKNFIRFIIQFNNVTETHDDCKELREALKLKYPELNYSITIIDGINSSEGVLTTKIVKSIT